MFELPSYVRLSEWITALVLVAASGGVAVRFFGVYPRDVYGGAVALLLAVNALLLWSLFRNHSLRRQRALVPERVSDGRKRNP